ncbi:hypothetical protein [Reichenbachiella versicolor]|uniref:hypothetical protein n=1 Tax=Reichenbachiella versicolor TaxID=1821036 RepID=UPI000D6E9481|nr:hypothetical protein [Reichenbachiella versicolor]
MAGKQIDNINAFSSQFLTTLKLINDGYAWLKWALTNPGLSVYYAQNEQDLLLKIQSGLHETLLLRCKAFTIHLETILTFDEADLELLIELFDTNASQSASIASLSKRYSLTTNKQLVTNASFLKQYNQTDAPVFQGIGFEDQLELYKFQKSIKEGEETNEAIAFALSKASNSSEFVHYSNFYINCINHQLTDQPDSAARSEQINDMYNMLDNVCFNLIYVPQVGSFNSQKELMDHLKDFISTTKFVGYQMKASAMDSLSKNIPIHGASDEQLRKNIEQFLSFIKQEVARGQFEPEPMPQDGQEQLFSITTEKYKTTIVVDTESNLFLSPTSGSIE